MATFEEVLNEERAQIFGRREFDEEPEGVGLAFSGGGIRSATFNLGILQGLSRAGLLNKIHYLSTVSGGGYIGGWLISWILRDRNHLEGVQQQLGDYPKFRPADETDVEPKQVNFLRDYSNYMTPRLGIFGADTWAAISTYLRNVMLNQLILVALLGSIVLLPWCVLTTCHAMARLENSVVVVRWCNLTSCYAASPFLDRTWTITAFGVLAALMLIWTVAWASVQCTRSSFTEFSPPKHAAQEWVLLFAITPLFCSAISTMIALWLAPSCRVASWSIWFWLLLGAGVYGLAHSVGVLCRRESIKHLKLNGYPRRPADPLLRLTCYQEVLIPVTAFGAGAVGGLFLKLLNKLFVYWKYCGHGFPYAITWGPLLFVGMFLFIGSLHIGLLKTLIQNEEQEWWGRAGGLLLVISIAWTGLFALTIFVPWLFATQGEWVKIKIGALLTWVATTAFGIFAGKSEQTSGQGDGNRGLEAVAIISPYVFVVGLMVLLSSGVFWIARFKSQDPALCVNCAVSERKLETLPGRDFALSLHVAGASFLDGKLALNGRLVTKPEALDRSQVADIEARFWEQISTLPVWRNWLLFVVLLGVTAVLAWRVDINIFSMNLLYRNRLVRCYLGASRKDCSDEETFEKCKKVKATEHVQEARSHGNQRPKCEGRRPNPFTGFDPNDDVPLALFRRPLTNVQYQGRRTTHSLRNVLLEVKKRPYFGPFPILCAALNVTHGEKLGWQERKAESFTFTPLYCGYDFQEANRCPGEGHGAYQPTEEYAYPKDPEDPSHPKIGGVRLGTAISISGAAASPNMGFHTSPPLAFLMTMFDVRLGWWLANSRYQNKYVSKLRPKGAPRWSLVYLLKELLASTTDRSKFVYLSDGGHFENLAVYELIRRRCKFIIACDADADEKVQFADLGNMIRKCRSDFGAEISIDTSKLQPIGDPAFAQVHGVIGEIYYPPAPGKNGKERDKGYILYIKPAITRGTPRDVLAYRDGHAPFPFQTTADQWFDESQFESYRRLGQYAIQTLSWLNSDPKTPPESIEELFQRVNILNRVGTDTTGLARA
jgi:hypothetical protein